MAKKKRTSGENKAEVVGLRRLDRNQARKRLSEILKEGSTSFSEHSLLEMKADDLTTVDVTNVLRAGKITQEPELTEESWRYRVHTDRITVVVAFRSDAEVRVVTSWRRKK